jgi:hypothetical protein
VALLVTLLQPKQTILLCHKFPIFVQFRTVGARKLSEIKFGQPNGDVKSVLVQYVVYCNGWPSMCATYIQTMMHAAMILIL